MLPELSRQGPRAEGILREDESTAVKFLRYAMAQAFAESIRTDILTHVPSDSGSRFCPCSFEPHLHLLRQKMRPNRELQNWELYVRLHTSIRIVPDLKQADS
jgi:hypothetical protein